VSVDLGELIPSLRREINPPGEDLFPNATNSEFLGNLVDGFWEAVLDGLITGYTVDEDGIITPVSGSTDLGREIQQLVVFYAGFRILRNVLRNLNTKFRAKAGPVEYETAQSANTLRDILGELTNRRNILLSRLSDMGYTETYYIDSVMARDTASDWFIGI